MEVSGQHLGSWNTARPRPSSLSLEQRSGTLPSPWTVTVAGPQPRHFLTAGRTKYDKDDNYSYPWLFFDPNTKLNHPVHCSEALFRRDNINVV